jgi:lipoprotein-releasing system permease protein
MTGIDLSAQPAVNTVDQHIVRGNWDALAEQRFSVALGSTLARILGVTVGDEVEVLLPRLTVTPLGIFPRVKRLVVVAEFEVGADPDASQSYVSLDTARRLLGRGEVDGLQIKVDELFAAPEITAALKQALPADLIVTDWRSSQGSLFTAVQMEKITGGLLLLSVVAVAAFNIVSTLTMSVTEKRTDIAVLRVLGASSRSILLVFIGYGMLLGVMGVVLGAILGVTLALHISEFATLVEQITGVSLFDPTVYYIGRLPSVLIWSDVFITVAAGLVLSFVATLYPAWRAAQISPVEVLNHG